MIRKMFAGGNTSQGFYSFFDQIAGEDVNRKFLLKGGPGTGKSTFMKHVAQAAIKQGYDVELFYCSSDSDSLDGILIPQKGVVVVDATAPHTQDPRFPGCRDEMINLGEFWDREAIIQNRDEIIRVTEENSKWFQKTYRYLRAAREIEENIAAQNHFVLDEMGLHQLGNKLLEELFEGRKPQSQFGRIRRMFASAITPQGLVSHIESLSSGFSNCYVLEGSPGTGISAVLERVLETASNLGIDTEAFHYPLIPEQVEHVLIPELDTALVTSSHIHPVDRLDGTHLDFNELLSADSTFPEDRRLLDQLLKRGIEMLRQAKLVHDQMEHHYVSHIDFSAVERLRDEVTDRILQ